MNAKRLLSLVFAAALLAGAVPLAAGCAPSLASLAPGVAVAEAPSAPLAAEVYHTGWAEGDCAYHAVTVGSDGKIYFSVSSHVPGQSAHVFVFDPAARKVKPLWQADRTLPAPGAVTQGKIHSPLAEWSGELLLATHTSWYRQDHRDAGTGQVRQPYPGGRVFSVNMATGRGTVVAAPLGEYRAVAVAGKEEVPMAGQGLIASVFDARNAALYVSSWPGAILARVDVRSGEVLNLGPRQERAETVPAGAPGYQRALRTLGLDRDGNVYGSDAHGRIWKYDAGARAVSPMQSRMEDGTRGEPPAEVPWLNMWRTLVWDDGERVFYGVHWSTSWLFRFDPRTDRIRPVAPWRARHMLTADVNPDYAQLGLAMGPRRVLYGLVHAPAAGEGTKRSVHLVTYDLARRELRDHGRVVGADGRALTFAESCAVAPNGDVYTVGWMEVAPELREELARKRLRGPEETAALPYLMALVRIPAEKISIGR